MFLPKADRRDREWKKWKQKLAGGQLDLNMIATG